MNPEDFYAKYKKCVANGEAVKEPGSDRLFCRKHKGKCSLEKCLKIHNKILQS